MYQMQNVEQLAIAHEEYRPLVDRWLTGELIASDRDIMIQIIDNVLPDDQILWPPYVMFNVDNGHITLTAHILDIQARA